MVPLADLRDLAAHETAASCPLAPHVSVQKAQVRELLPTCRGHLAEQRTLAVHDSSCDSAARVLAERVDLIRKRQLVLVERRDGSDRAPCSAACRASAHVHLSAKRGRRPTGRARHHRHAGRLLRDRRRAGEARNSASESRRSSAIARGSATAVYVGDPLAALREYRGTASTRLHRRAGRRRRSDRATERARDEEDCTS